MYAWPVLLPAQSNREDFVKTLSLFDDETGDVDRVADRRHDAGCRKRGAGSRYRCWRRYKAVATQYASELARFLDQAA
jgi:hypothetical protein